MKHFLEALALLWILAHEIEDPDDGEERSFASYLAMEAASAAVKSEEAVA